MSFLSVRLVKDAVERRDPDFFLFFKPKERKVLREVKRPERSKQGAAETSFRG